MEPKLFNVDCLDIMPWFPDESVDLVVTDPPYGMNYRSRRRKQLYDPIKNDKSISFIPSFFEQRYRVMRNDTAIYCFCSWHNVDLFKQAFESFFALKNILVWVKNNHGSGDLRASYAPRYEFVLYGNKGRREFENGRMDDVFYANKTGNKNHPTEKPVDLVEIFIKNSSTEGQIVFDGFMGSGSTGVACVKNKRDFIGVEIDPGYFNVAKTRIFEAQDRGSLI